MAPLENCTLCSRLREHCLKVAREKKKAHANEGYWGKPISGLGEKDARLFILGLAPAAHGANRTGRIFTGDRSGEWLFRALHRFGFCNQARADHRDDGLKLINTYLTCSVKCAPPDNLPYPDEKANCLPYLTQELKEHDRARIYIALGRYAYDTLWPLIETGKKPAFQHGKVIELSSGQTLILSYHPSQQNTFTGRLTEESFDQIFELARAALSSKAI